MKRVANTYLRGFFMALAILILSLFLLPFVCLFPKKLYWSWGILAKVVLFILGARVQISGQIPSDGRPYIIVGNHTSFIDIFLIAIYFRSKPGTVFLHQKLLKIPVLGIWMKLLKVIPINPQTNTGVLAGIKRAVYSLKEKRVSLVIFPEGTRTSTGQMTDFKPGALSIAVISQADIIPLAFVGSFQFKPKNRWWIEPGKIQIKTGDIIRSAGRNKEELSVTTQEAIRKML